MVAQHRPIAGTQNLAAWVTGDRTDTISERALMCARHAVLDWMGVALAGSSEPVSRILADDAIANEENGDVGAVGYAQRFSPAFAALINGTSSHALDYDDVNKRMRGHPTVTVLPAILAAAGVSNSSGREVLEALVVGVEVACIVGEMLGSDHYDRGFHTTATAGTIGAAAAVARLAGLTVEQTSMAIGLAATQAAGLKVMFGSMAKPLHAGKAAMNGLLSARWAAAGLTAHPAVLECEQGLGQTMSAASNELLIRPDAQAPFGIEENIHKYHAACFYTHSAITAVNSMILDGEIRKQDISKVIVHLMPKLLDVCDIKEPKSGLEIKFSLRHLLAMVICGMDTSDITIYSAEVANATELCSLRRIIHVVPENFDSRTKSRVTVDLTGAPSCEKLLDVGLPAEDLELQLERLSAKYLSLAVPAIGVTLAEAARNLVLNLDQLETLDDLFDILCRR